MQNTEQLIDDFLTPFNKDVVSLAQVLRKHINISFPSGTSLNDLKGLLQGKGSGIRRIRANSMEDLKKPTVVDLLSQARNRANELAEANQSKHPEFETFVKERTSGK